MPDPQPALSPQAEAFLTEYGLEDNPCVRGDLAALLAAERRAERRVSWILAAEELETEASHLRTGAAALRAKAEEEHNA